MLNKIKLEDKNKEHGLKIIDVLIIQYFLCFAGLFYGILYKDLNLILLFGVQMVFNAILQLRTKKYIQQRNKF